MVPGGGTPGVGPTRGIDDKQSTLSRYWTMDRSLQRKLGKTNYQHIKRLCRDRGQLFEDSDFPPSNKAIYSHKKPALHPIVWMRPHVSISQSWHIQHFMIITMQISHPTYMKLCHVINITRLVSPPSLACVQAL